MKISVYFTKKWRFRDLGLYSLALLGTSAFAAAIWAILSATLSTPTSVEVATKLGIIGPLSGLVKPEPVENYTFLLSTGVGILLFGLAGYCSAVIASKPAPIAKLILALSLLLATLWILIWFTSMRWDSIIPPNPSVLLSVPVAHPGIFFVLTIFTSALFWFASKIELSEKWRHMPLALCVVPLLVLSRMVLFNNDDNYVSTTHYEVFAYPLIQDWLNSGIHLTQKSQYGIYPIFLRPLWFLVGTPTTAAVTFVMSVLLFIANLAMLAFMYRFNRHKTTATVFGLFAIIFSLLFYPFWPGDAYFFFFPVRLVFPALSMVFMCLPLTRLRYPWVAYAVLAFGLAWNFESGLIGLVMFGVFSTALRFAPSWSVMTVLVLRQLAMALASVAFSALCVISYYLYRFGAVPQLGGVLTMIKAFSAGVGAEPMPMFGAWIFHVLIYGAAIFIGIRWLFNSPNTASREQAAALLALAAMGLLWLRYYQGRSLTLPLTHATMSAIFCLGIFMDAAVSALPRHQKIASKATAIVIGAPLLAALFLWAGTDPVPQRKLSEWINESANARLNLIVDRVIELFESNKRRTKDRLLVVAPYAHLVQLKLQQPHPINVAGMCQFWFESEIDNLVSVLNDPNTRAVVFDSNDFCSISGVVTHPRVEALLLAKFDLLSTDEGCSLSRQENMKMFVERRSDQDKQKKRFSSHNIAVGREASESSSFGSSQAAAAVDGIIDGRLDRGSTTHTGLQPDPWWQVDLGRSVPIQSVQIWNRTDCCSERLKDYWVFVSDKPFEKDQNLEELKKRPDIEKSFQTSIPCPNTTVSFPPAHGRYVRVQLQGAGYLSLAEVKVFASGGKLE